MSVRVCMGGKLEISADTALAQAQVQVNAVDVGPINK